MLANCFRFAPRDSVSGLIAKICKYLKDHPGWSEEDLKEEIAKLVHEAGVQSFNGRTGDVVLTSEDVNALKIATAYFGEDDETIDEFDIKALYDVGIRFVFTDFNPVTSSYNNSYVLDYFPGSDEIAYYPISTSEGGGGAVTSVNGKTGDVTINLADVLGASGAQVKLCAATEFTSNTIETWNAYYEDGYRIVGVVNDGATAVDYLYLLKHDENNHKPIEFCSVSGAGAVDSVNGQTGVVTIGEVGVVEEVSEATQYMKVFVDESRDYESIINATQLNGKTEAELILEIYPVGSIYISVSNTSPASLFGGTWERLKDRFLLGAGDSYSAGNTGGETQHTLTDNELPIMEGSIAIHGAENGTILWHPTGVFSVSPIQEVYRDIGGTRVDNIKSITHINYKAGGDQPHNNMPPYLAVYMWKRVS